MPFKWSNKILVEWDLQSRVEHFRPRKKASSSQGSMETSKGGLEEKLWLESIRLTEQSVNPSNAIQDSEATLTHDISDCLGLLFKLDVFGSGQDFKDFDCFSSSSSVSVSGLHRLNQILVQHEEWIKFQINWNWKKNSSSRAQVFQKQKYLHQCLKH